MLDLTTPRANTLGKVAQPPNKSVVQEGLEDRLAAGEHRDFVGSGWVLRAHLGFANGIRSFLSG